uniref:Restriction endonuclease n=1 Tax=Marseillevirus LCMAC202 TaxID=2506606 RepID=A0A481YWT6_9VIRU|nr:MAG: restriction endonuclease [Marseillevirus LCMAC202]
MLYPELCDQWSSKNNKLPTEFLPGSGKKVWWVCPKDPHHEWIATISDRTTKHSGCPICSNYKICPCGCNSLASKRPDIAQEWDYEQNTKTPQQVPYSSGAKVWWTCSKYPHHKWKTSVDHRNRFNTGCPYCKNTRVCPCGCNSLAQRFPKIAEEWDHQKNNKLPKEYTYQSTIKVWWVCPKNSLHNWKTAIYYRTSPKQLTGCPFCNESQGEKRIIVILNDLDISWKREKRFSDCVYKQTLPYDLYLPDYDILIEFDGMHHFKKNRYYDKDFLIRDLIKTIYARNRYFLRISYEEITDLENIITNFITDVINNDITTGFYYNYGQKNLSNNITEIYRHHECCTLDNIQKTREQLLLLFEVDN